jgi:hypothetical protein
MKRAQGALEYLIIIAAVLGISAVVVLFVSGAFTSSTAGADISKCRLAAANCQKDLALGVGTSCNYCTGACTDSGGRDVIDGTQGKGYACIKCNQGNVAAIQKGIKLTVGLVNHSSCVCAWTVSNCATWWKERLIEKGFNVISIDATTLQDINLMRSYKAILNPYGEYYLDYGADPYAVLNNIREYVRQGGYWFEYGGYPFYYSCSTNVDPYSAGSDTVCIGITSFGTADNRSITSYGRTVSPNGPSSIIGDRRASAGNDFATVAACVPLASGASYNPLYFNSTYNFAGPVAHCYGSGCIVRSDKLTINDVDIATIYADFMKSKVF